MLSASGNLFKCHEEVLYLQPLMPPKRFDIFSPITGGCSEGLGVLWFFFKRRSYYCLTWRAGMHSVFPVSSYLWSDIFDTFWVVRRCSMYNCILCRLSSTSEYRGHECRGDWQRRVDRVPRQANCPSLPWSVVAGLYPKPNRFGDGWQTVRVVAGSEGATDESTPDCPHCALLYYCDSALSCAYNQPVMPEDTLCSTPLHLNKPPKTNMHCVETPGIGAKKT